MLLPPSAPLPSQLRRPDSRLGALSLRLAPSSGGSIAPRMASSRLAPAASAPSSSLRRAQGTTEYLLLLALALIMALIILGISSFFPGFAYDAQAADSSRYWSTAASPLAIVDYYQTGVILSLVVENRAPVQIQLDSLTLSSASSYAASSLPQSLAPGGQLTLTATAEDCSGRQGVSYAVALNYSTDQVSNLYQGGAKPLFVRCIN